MKLLLPLLLAIAPITVNFQEQGSEISEVVTNSETSEESSIVDETEVEEPIVIDKEDLFEAIKKVVGEYFEGTPMVSLIEKIIYLVTVGVGALLGLRSLLGDRSKRTKLVGDVKQEITKTSAETTDAILNIIADKLPEIVAEFMIPVLEGMSDKIDAVSKAQIMTALGSPEGILAAMESVKDKNLNELIEEARLRLKTAADAKLKKKEEVAAKISEIAKPQEQENEEIETFDTPLY